MTRALKSRVPHPRGVFVFVARVGDHASSPNDPIREGHE